MLVRLQRRLGSRRNFARPRLTSDKRDKQRAGGFRELAARIAPI
jgi:hypothetical protein